MAGYTVKAAEFLRGSPDPFKFPSGRIPEIGIVGRSNVGKSTFINRITGRKNLARSSRTPGRTREFNLFEVKLLTPEANGQIVHLMDFPGFGYAKFSMKERAALNKAMVEVINSRESLKVICLLNDCRRDPGGDELAIRDLAFKNEKILIVAATKIDKLKAKEKTSRLKQLASCYGLEKEDLLPTGLKTNPFAVWERISALL